MKFLGALFLLFSFQLEAATSATCQFYRKDYDSPGFGIPYRSGFYIKGRFGCVYECACNEQSPRWKVTHVLEEKHFDMNVFSKATGGASAAKWFICPYSIDPHTWTPHRDELGRILYYSVEESHREFPASEMGESSQIRSWNQQQCQL